MRLDCWLRKWILIFTVAPKINWISGETSSSAFGSSDPLIVGGLAVLIPQVPFGFFSSEYRTPVALVRVGSKLAKFSEYKKV